MKPKRTTKAADKAAKESNGKSTYAAPPSRIHSGGLLVIAGKVPVHVSDAAGNTQRIKPGKTLNFLPAPVAGGKSGLEETAAFRPAPPSSALWIGIHNAEDIEAAVALDPGDLQRDAARWGRPSVLVCNAAEKHPNWKLIESRTQFALVPGSRLLVMAIGHGLAVDPATVFSSLLTSAASHRAKALKGRDENAK